MESHYLESLERESSPSMCDMERQDYIDQINDLKATNNNNYEELTPEVVIARRNG